MMDTKKRVKVHIYGNDYFLTTDESEKYVQELGEALDRTMREIISGDSRISTTMAAVMAAMMYADETRKSGDSADRLRLQLKEYLDDNARIRAEADSLRAELAELRRRHNAGGRS